MAQTDNSVYDLVAILHNKMKGVAAYEKYEKDFKKNESVSDLLEDIKNTDEEHIERLQQELAQMLPAESGGESDKSDDDMEESNRGRSHRSGRRQLQSASR